MMGWQTLGLLLAALYEATYRGYAQIILWPSSTEWGYRSHHVLVAGIVLSLLLYLRARLEKAQNYLPSSGILLLKLIAVLESVVLIGALFGPYEWFALTGIIVALFSLLTILACTYIYYRNGGQGHDCLAAGLCPGIRCIATRRRTACAQYLSGSASRAICACAARPDDRPFHYHQLGLSIFPSKASGAAHIAAMAKPAARAPGTRGRAQNQRAQRGSRTSRATFAGTKELLAYVSHDLRAPVSAIIAYLQLMHQSPNKVDTDKLAAIERSAAYQLALIDEPGGLCQR